MAYIGVILEIDRSWRAAIEVMKGYPENTIEVVRVDDYNCGVKEAKRLVKEGVVALVTRAGYLSYLRNANLSVPIIDIPFTTNNVIRSCVDAYTRFGTIGIVGSQYVLEQAHTLDGIIGSAIKYYLAVGPLDYSKVAREAARDGVKVLVGGYDETRYAETEGMDKVILSSEEEELRDAIREAMKIVKQINAEVNKREELQTFFDIIGDALMMFDEKGNIVQLNKRAQIILRRAANHGQPLMNEQFKEKVLAVIASGENVLYDLQEYAGEKYVCDIRKIGSGYKGSGAVVKLQSVKYVQSVEQSTRARLAQRGLTAKYSFEHIIGESLKMQDAIYKAKRYSHSDSTILITGESGTGKELFAQGIHNFSPRVHGPFVAVNCSTFPESLLESELFGYSEGAFTGAKKGGKAGLFELAHNGTLFLDEVGEMNLNIQARLLRILEEKQVMRIGDDKMIPINVRIIAATNKNLRKMVYEGKFREDLYFRLNVLGIFLPAVRDRKEDIKLLLEHFLSEKSEKMGCKEPTLTNEAYEMLLKYPWTGNVREIANLTERLVITSDGQPVGAKELESFMFQAFHTEIPRKLTELSIDTVSDTDIIEAMKKQNGNKSAVAIMLGMSRPTLYRRLKKINKGNTA